MTVTLTFKGVELTVTGEYTPYTPGRVNADPYDCYDAEGGTFDAESVFCGRQDITDLVDYRMEEIEEAAAEILANDM
jgi:hypothetical protein